MPMTSLTVTRRRMMMMMMMMMMMIIMMMMIMMMIVIMMIFPCDDVTQHPLQLLCGGSKVAEKVVR